jgi:hypothetical protein
MTPFEPLIIFMIQPLCSTIKSTSTLKHNAKRNSSASRKQINQVKDSSSTQQQTENIFLFLTFQHLNN